MEMVYAIKNRKRLRGCFLLAVAFLLPISGCATESADAGKTAAESIAASEANGSFPAPGVPVADYGLPEPEARESPLVISELMASNGATLPDQNGSFPDWVEIINRGPDAVNLNEWRISQDNCPGSGSPLPGDTLKPGERTVVFCGGTGQNGDTSFCLSAKGESIFLFGPSGECFELTYPALDKDVSYALQADGSYIITREASPGFENTAEGALRFRRESDRSDELIISEVMTKNESLLRQDDRNYYDWVELCNRSEVPLNLGEYSLTDNPEDAERSCALPDTVLNPGEYFLVICSGDSSLSNYRYTHASFTLNAADETLYLLKNGRLQDYLSLHLLPLNGSFGRFPGERGSFYYTVPTPGAPNGAGFAARTPLPQSDLPQGVYENVDSLSVTLSGRGTIRYTTDGSVPTLDSPAYERPLVLNETTVIRAACFEENALTVDTATFSYIINEGHSLPVVSLTVDPVEMFTNYTGSERNIPGGIYHISSEARMSPELPASMAFFDENGSCAAECGVQLHGASSRNTREKKSLKLTFRGCYGGNLEYDLFGDGEVASFFSIGLRSGYMKDATLLRDEVCAALARSCSDNILCLNDSYCVLYINGEYWGIYSLREAYSTQYVSDHLGTEDKDTAFISRAPARVYSCRELYEFFSMLRSRHYTDPYAEIEKRFDIASLTDWMIMEAYTGNYDIAGNIRYLRGSDDDLWRYGFFDLDFSLRTETVNWYDLMDGNQFSYVVKTVLDNPDYIPILWQRMGELFAGPLNEDAFLEILDRDIAAIESELPREYARWSEGQGDKTVEEWRDELARCISADRQRQCVEGLMDYLRLNESERQEIYSVYFPGLLGEGAK